MYDITTTDLSKFGYREIVMAKDLLTAWVEGGLPEDFTNDDVTIMMNRHSSYVFLTNSEHEVAMMNGEELESFYTLPYSGAEGFKDELADLDRDGMDAEDISFMVDLGIIDED